MTQTTSNATIPAPEANKAPKPVSKWRYRLIIASLGLIILLMLGGSAYGGWYLWRMSESRQESINKLQNEVNDLRKDRNISVDDLQRKLDSQSKELTDLKVENTRVSDELSASKARVDQLTPKNIKDLNYKQIIRINEVNGDVWLNPVYADITGDGREDGVYAYRMAGTGGFLNVYVYSYLDGNTLNQLLKAEEYQKGVVTYIGDQNIVEIKSQSGTPDAPVLATSRFKWDPTTKKMVKLP